MEFKSSDDPNEFLVFGRFLIKLIVMKWDGAIPLKLVFKQVTRWPFSHYNEINN